MEMSEQINEVAKALAKAQGEMKSCVKDGISKFMAKGKEVVFEYSTIDSVLSCAIDCLSKNELCVVQDLTHGDKGIFVETRLIHSSGQWFSFGPFHMPCVMSAHEIAGATTYARRYTLCSAMGIAGEKDNDNNPVTPVLDTPKPSEEPMKEFCTQMQIDRLLLGLKVTPEEVSNICRFNNVDNLKSLTVMQASKAISNIEKKREKDEQKT